MLLGQKSRNIGRSDSRGSGTQYCIHGFSRPAGIRHGLERVLGAGRELFALERASPQLPGRVDPWGLVAAESTRHGAIPDTFDPASKPTRTSMSTKVLRPANSTKVRAPAVQQGL